MLLVRTSAFLQAELRYVEGISTDNCADLQAAVSYKERAVVTA